MSISRRYWLFFLIDSPSGMPFYVAPDGSVQKGNIALGNDLSLPQSPEGWQDIQISFGRNTHYWGMNRTFTIPLKFVGNGAKIVRHLFYNGKGIESPVGLVVCKWDDMTGVFRLYYSGLLDLSKIDDQVAEGVSVNIMEGGAAQMLKAYENSMIEIPCDGSIPENIKINADGILFNDTFHYQFVPVENNGGAFAVLPCAFVSNDGDNIGITKAEQVSFQDLASPGINPLTYRATSQNYLFSAQEATSVRIKGSIVVRTLLNGPIPFSMLAMTSLSQTVTGGYSNIQMMVPSTGPLKVTNVTLSGQSVYYFDVVINLAANEHLFLFFASGTSSNHCVVIGGNFSLTFNSRYRASRVWGMTMFDLGKLLMKRISGLSSNFLQTFNFGFDSTLLKAKLNYFVTSGDAARASTDPNYYQFYNQATINPTNPNNQDYNQFTSLGPVIKTSLSDYFDAINPVANASLGNQQLPGEAESIFVEAKKHVLDPSAVTMSLAKISNFHVSVALDYYWNWLDIGYEEQQYDEKAGKFEYNNQFHWQAPIKTIAKKLQLISKYRADSYGFEYTRYNTDGGKSTTYNNSDNSIFMLNADYSSSIFDFFAASFISDIPDPTVASNTNQALIGNSAFQPVVMDQLDGEYFTSNNDFSIFIFNQPISSVLYNVGVTGSVLLNGLAGDSCAIRMWINGVNTTTWSQTITGVNTPLSIAFASAHFFSKGDCIYFTVSTVKTCTATISAFELAVTGTDHFVCDSSGDIVIAAGETQQLISLPIVSATLVAGKPIVSYGIQYFEFLSAVQDTTFNWTLAISGFTQGSGSEIVTLNIWKNGVIIGTFTHPGVASATQFNPSKLTDLFGTITFALYDLVWITASSGNLNAWVSYVDLTFTSGTIKAYSLNRPAYSNVSGIPNPQTAFNIADFTPGAMLRANGSLLASTLFNLAPGQLTYQTADKNPFLSTTLNGVMLKENANIDIHDLPDPLFYPLIFEFDTEVPVNFSDLLTNAANGHIEFMYNNKTFYGFPMQVTSKPAFNESQTWKLLCSPKTNLADLVDLDWDGMVPLMLMDALIPIICPVHFVPLGYTKPSQYHNYTMDQDWFVNRITQWIDSNNYYAPWQSNDLIQLQCQTYGLDPVNVQIINCYGSPVGSPVNIPSITSSSVQAPQTLYQGPVDISALAEGFYYLLWTMGVGEGMATFISEGIQIKNDWGNQTLRVDYTNSRNKLATVFSNGYAPSFRIHGQISRYTPKSKFTTFVDQPQDVDLLNAIPYDTWKLEIGRGSGIPDYMQRKMDRILLLDTVLIEGDQYSRDADAQWEQQTFPGEPKTYMSIDIRRAKNEDAITLNTANQLDSNMFGGYTLDASAFGQSGSAGNLIEVQGS